MGVRVGDRWRPAPNRGIADILGITAQGRFIAIEVKSGKYMKPTTEQIVFLENIANKNGVAMVVHSFDEFSLKYREITEV